MKKKAMDFLSKMFIRHRNIILYIIIGSTAATIDLIVYLILFNLVDVRAVLSTIISVFVATVFGFIMNATVNFKVSDKLLFRFISYSTVSTIGIGLSATMIYLFHDIFSFDGNIVKICSMPPIVFIQYLLNKTVSFKKREGKQGLDSGDNQ